MNVLPFPSQGDSPDLPSLEEMRDALKKNFKLMDEIDRDFFSLIDHVVRMGVKAEIKVIVDSRSIAWHMMNRYGVKV